MLFRRACLLAALAGFASPATVLAATSIFVQAGATGNLAGTFSLGVSYFSPYGLTVSDSAPTNGNSYSYSPGSAPAGLTAITLAAAVNGKSSGSSMASADLASATVRATAKSDTFQSSGNAYGELDDDLNFTVLGGGSRQIGVAAHLDGTIGTFANGFSLSGLSYILNFGTSSNVIFTSLGTQNGFTVTTGGASSPVPRGWDSYSLSNVTATGFDFSGLVTVADGEMRHIIQRLQLTCQEGVDCDFSHTGSIGLQLPDGVSFTSGSGVFLNPPVAGPVPEPATWAMMIAGFVAIGGTSRRLRAAVSGVS